MPHSHHSHSGAYCRHAKDVLESVIKEAIRQGFSIYGLSEHAPRYRIEDLFPEESDLTPGDLCSLFDSYLIEARRLQKEYADRISLLVGLESDYITQLDLERTRDMTEKQDEIQYIVGSVHHVRGVSIDFDRQTWLRAVRQSSLRTESTTMIHDPDTNLPTLPSIDINDSRLGTDHTPSIAELRPFLLDYFEAQFEMLQYLQPEVVGHFDLCLLWTPEVDLRSRELDGLWEKVVRNVEYVVGYGGLIEANAAALRKGWDTSYPGKAILELIIERGGRVCLSDDSHGVSYVGLNYPRLRDYLLSMGLKDVWYLVPTGNRRTGDVEVEQRRRVVARRMEGDWAAHPFWASLGEKQHRQ